MLVTILSVGCGPARAGLGALHNHHALCARQATEADARRYGDVLPRTKLETVVRTPRQASDQKPCTSMISGFCSFCWLLALQPVPQGGNLP